MSSGQATRAEYMREYRRKNPEKYKKIDKAAEEKKRAKDPTGYREKANERSRQYQARQKLKPKTPEEVAKKKAAAAERQRRYMEKNGDKAKALRRAAAKTYYHRHREKCLARTHRRRAALEEGEVTGAQWLEILRRHNGLCVYCGINKGDEMDHVIPLSKGGTHTPDNVVPACRHCNTSKSDGQKPKSLPADTTP